MCTTSAHHLPQKQQTAPSNSLVCMPLREGSSDCTRQQDIWAIKTDSLPEISSGEKSGCRRMCSSGSSVKRACRLKQLGRGKCFQQMLFFLPSKYKDALPSSADKYKHICTEQRLSFVFIFFVFAELKILWFHSNFPKALSVITQRAKLSHLPAPIPLNQETADCIATNPLRENEQVKELGKAEGSGLPVADAAQFFTSRHSGF